MPISTPAADALIDSLKALSVEDLVTILQTALNDRDDSEYRGRSGVDSWLLVADDESGNMEITINEPWDL